LRLMINLKRMRRPARTVPSRDRLTGRRPRIVGTVVLSAIVFAALAARATAGVGLLVGVDDDSAKWGGRTPAMTAAAGALHLDAVRITLSWSRGEAAPTSSDLAGVRQAVSQSDGARLVVAVYGRAADAPQTDADRTAYCSYLASLARTVPSIRDFVVWNEVNSAAYWQPQFDPVGASVAPAAYEALLARCWDMLHAVRPDVNVITSSAAHGNDSPRAPGADHSPDMWYRDLGAAYRASGRTQRIFDTVGHNPYPDSSREPPTTTHPHSTTIGEGDYGRLMEALSTGFAGTAQPLPGQDGVSIWYLENGYQSSLDPTKRALYGGAENVPVVDPAVQAQYLASAVRLAYCQPAVGAYFNFQLADESSLAGWQSGLLWADGTAKPAYQAFATAIAAIRAGAVGCAGGVPTADTAPVPAPAPPPATPQAHVSAGNGTSGVLTLVIHPGG